MRGNRRASGKRTTRPFPGCEADAAATETYRSLDTAAIRQVGTAYWGELAEFSYWVYDRLNPAFFAGRIPHPLFQFCRVMPYGGCVGLSHTGDLDRPVIDVFLSLWTRRKQPCAMVFGVIVHELLHFQCGLLWRDAGRGWYRTSHQNEFWLSEVKRLAPLLGADLKEGDEPHEAFPHASWSEAQLKKFDRALSQREFPFGT
jgi:hypothetical protein